MIHKEIYKDTWKSYLKLGLLVFGEVISFTVLTATLKSKIYTSVQDLGKK